MLSAHTRRGVERTRRELRWGSDGVRTPRDLRHRSPLVIRPRLLGALVALAVAVAACGGDGDTAAEPTAPPSPSVSATATTGPSEVPSPTVEPTPVAIAPLTGEGVDDLAVEDRPALAVKIENTKAARPQAGLEAADIVYEELVEGGITRFFAVFQSELPSIVGPIRSGRPIDAAILPPYDGILAYSGARDEVTAALHATGATLLVEGRQGFFREPSRKSPHNLFGNAEELVQTGLAVGDPGPATGWLTFTEDPPAGARDCSGPAVGCDGEAYTVVMSPVAESGWLYDETAGVYLRSQNGIPQPTLSGEPVGAANVVILGTQVVDGGCCDSSGARYTDTVLTGEGRAIVLRDGRWYEGTWRKPSADDHIELVTGDGRPMSLKPGKTWIHLAPAGNLPPAN